jgi:hypothetical protein
MRSPPNCSSATGCTLGPTTERAQTIASGEAHLISSKCTAVFKFVLPAGWITGFGFATFLLFRSAIVDDVSPPPGGKWIFFVIWITGSAFWYRLCVPLKKVTMNRNELIISNYAREIRVPLGRIRACLKAVSTTRDRSGWCLTRMSVLELAYYLCRR